MNGIVWFVVCLLVNANFANSATSPPTRIPSVVPTVQPSQPTFEPTYTITSRPSALPSSRPTVIPLSRPTSKPSTPPPSSYPTSFPTTFPSAQPSTDPTGIPSYSPTVIPSAQPSLHPSSSPSVQPSSSPSIDPTGQPSRQPSLQPVASPTMVPSVQPTSCPSLQPASYPTCQPTCQPSSVPTSQPSGFPSFQPSAQPTSNPTSPTSQPSTQPSVQPSRQPSKQPSTVPTTIPSTQPSDNPSAQPASHPTMQPTAQPSSFPSLQPTSKPSSQPSFQPTSAPSSIPTSAPSAIPPCPAGTYYLFDFEAPGGYRCINCGVGKSSNASSTICFDCPQGSYAPLENSPECILCPVNSYQTNTGSENCNSCGPGSITNQEGSTDPTLCVNPSTNFILGGLALFVVLVSSWIYLFDGRLLKVGFLRRYILVERAYIYYGRILEVVEILSSTGSIISSAIDNARTEKSPRWKIILFAFLSIILVPLIIILFIFFALVQIVFNGMVIWRGYVGVLHLPYNIREQIQKVAEIIDNLVGIKVFSILGYPLAYIIGALSNLQIDLTTVNVTCVGAQVPFYLLINIFIVGVIIIIVKSELQVFWTSCISSLCGKSFRVLFNPFYLSTKTSTALFHAFIGSMIIVLPNPSKVIQYALGFVSVTKFFAQHGRSRSDANCDAATSYPVDTILAIATTVCAVIILFPIIYMISQVLVPCFKPHKLSMSINYNCCRGVAAYQTTTNDEVHDNSKKSEDDINELDQNKTHHFEQQQQRREETVSKWYPNFSRSISCTKRWATIEDDEEVYQPGIYSMLNVFSVDRFLVKLLCMYGKIIFTSHQNFIRNPPIKEMNNEEIEQIKDILNQNAMNVITIDLSDCDTAWLNVVEPQIFANDQSLPNYWDSHKLNSPPYRRFIGHVYADLPFNPDKTIFPVRLVSYLLSCTIFGQFLTVYGWSTWVRVLRNYYIIILVSFGIWPETIVEEFQLLNEYKDFYYKVNMEHRIAASKVASNYDIFRSIEMDGKVMFASYMSAKIVTRLVLIQLVPALTIWSIFAVSVSDCPIFVFSEKLRDELPPLIDWNPLQTMQEEYAEAIEHLEAWKKAIIAARVFVMNSRLIRFLSATLSCSVSVGMVFFPNSFAFLVVILVITLVILGAILGLYIVVLLHNFMFPRHDENHNLHLGRKKVADEENMAETELIPQYLHVEIPANTSPLPGFDPFEVDTITPVSPNTASSEQSHSPDGKAILQEYAARNQKLNTEQWLMDEYQELMVLNNNKNKL